jgi:hypothetical protein
MRVTRSVAVTVLGLLAAACGGGAPSAHASPSITGSAPGTNAGTTTTTTASARRPAVPTSGGTPAMASPTTASTAAAPVASAPAATPAARTAAPTPVPAPCGVADVALSTTTDLPHYTPAQNVQISVAVRNQSAHSCIFGAPGDFTVDADPSGPSVFAVHLDCPPDGCPPLAPGQMSTYPITWDQTANQGPGRGSPAAAGSYHARAAFSGYPISTSASFTLGA